ncbi:MAG: Ku protein [Variovorax paradoxus]|uniref:Non-homologous end joining protein Ku n=1 Tax=Variovorax paradoxus TaxID=34073 RepID=A0A2W5QMY3_VARPD|nr:MAG: Ku protein [Variovorax paradoxus]
MASGTRTLWKGAITFGLVHIPVGLHTAATESGVDFDWLDKRSMDPVGYKRINKRTGKEIDRDNIVKGVEYEDGKYVIISPEEIEKVYPRTTQTIEIVQFVDAGEISFVYLERPYYLEPINKGQKVYALLRDVLQKTGKIGVAKVVIATKQHLAAVVPAGRALVLNLMRWGDEVRPLEGLDLPPESTKASTAETKMAVQLVKEMTAPWKPSEFEDEFKHKVMELVQKKVKAGETETVIEPEEEAPGEGAEVIDLSELLKRSLKGGGSSRKTSAAKTTSAAKATKKSPAAKKSAPKKHAATERKAA